MAKNATPYVRTHEDSRRQMELLWNEIAESRERRLRTLQQMKRDGQKQQKAEASRSSA